MPLLQPNSVVMMDAVFLVELNSTAEENLPSIVNPGLLYRSSHPNEDHPPTVPDNSHFCKDWLRHFHNSLPAECRWGSMDDLEESHLVAIMPSSNFILTSTSYLCGFDAQQRS